jgi:NAD(P)-dependent dehydrogenase (short-subunit alcohol dehydrogenase family)
LKKTEKEQLMRLEGEVALVTGAAKGIGAECARLFAREGASVALTDIDVDGVKRVVKEIEAAGGKAIGLEHNVVLETDWEDVIARTVDKFGALSVLINNAGIGPSGDHVENLEFKAWRNVLAVDLDSVFLGCKHGVRAMKTNGGSIVNVSSIMGIVGSSGTADYNAAKGGVKLLTKSVALECAENHYGIRVNSVHPGFTETPLLESGVIVTAEADGQKSVEDVKAAIISRHPVGRMARPLEIAKAVLFLASDESSFVTGSELVVDGGYTAQ